MQRIAIIVILLSAYKTMYAEFPVDFFIQSEYKKDSIDYNETEKNYYREKLSVFFSQESVFNLSYIRVDQEKENRFTAYLLLKDISPHISILLGNYFAHFGSGLLIGRKRHFDPDIFTVSNSSYRQTFSPCNTGNPVFAFNGTAASYSYDIYDTKISLNLFYSIKERFIDEESYNTGKIGCTMDTIDNKTGYDYNQNEPLEIHTGGAMLSSIILTNILIEAYYLNADIRSQYKDDFAWEYLSDYNESSGISKLDGFGFFAEYKDNFLKFFGDGAMSRKKIVSNCNNIEKYGYGLIYGIKFNPPFLKISITGKEVGSSFYSPYSSTIGDDYPESAWFFDTEIKPYANFKAITQLSSEKRTAPSSADEDIPVINKENITVIYNYNYLEELNLSWRRRERIDDENETKQEYKLGMGLKLSQELKIKLAALYLFRSNTDPSRVYTMGFGYSPAEYLCIHVNYIKGSISDDNEVYTAVLPIKDSAIKGFYIRQDSDTIILKSDLKYNGIFLSCRYLSQFHRHESIFKKFEIYASGYF